MVTSRKAALEVTFPRSKGALGTRIWGRLTKNWTDRKHKSPRGEEGSQLAGVADSLFCAVVITESARQTCPTGGDWLGQYIYILDCTLDQKRNVSGTTGKMSVRSGE